MEGVDREEMRNYKSTKAFNYFYSNKVGRIFLLKHGDYVFLKAELDRSQSANQPKLIAWVMLHQSGVIETVGCSCIADLGDRAVMKQLSFGRYEEKNFLLFLSVI